MYPPRHENDGHDSMNMCVQDHFISTRTYLLYTAGAVPVLMQTSVKRVVTKIEIINLTTFTRVLCNITDQIGLM